RRRRPPSAPTPCRRRSSQRPRHRRRRRGRRSRARPTRPAPRTRRGACARRRAGSAALVPVDGLGSQPHHKVVVEMRPYYVTTAIAYPNGAPHVGHAYEYIATDAIARFKRLDGFDVRFLTGTDEHGLKMAETAAAEGIPTAQLARRNSDVFERLQQTLNISFDRFIRTTDTDHLEASKAIWKRMNDNGDIYLDTYSGWYSVRDERYFTEDETVLEPRQNGQDTRVAVETGAPVTWTEEQTYFFRLSAYTDKLLAHYEAHPEFIGPDVRRNEVVSFVSGGLKDLSISRTTFDWGVPVPGHPEHVMYVWVDALTNYLTGVGFPD